MLRLFAIALAALALSACSFFHPYRPDVQQGNVIKASQVKKLHKDMTQSEVEKILGQPVLENTFDNSRLVYVYELYPNQGKTVKKQLILKFQDSRLIKITQHNIDGKKKS